MDIEAPVVKSTNSSYAGVDEVECCMAASNHHEQPRVFPREMMRMTFINQPTKRPTTGSCFAQGIDRLAAYVWSTSGRAAD
jgi:hypothetical protein